MSDEMLDRAIDGAVREMLDVEPPAGLRARVLHRIDGSQAASGFSRKILWLGVPLGAAAAIVLAVLLPVRHAQAPATPPVQVAENRPAPAPERRPAPAVTTPSPSGRAGAPARVMAVRRDVTATARAAVVAASLAADDQAASIEPLTTITPIALAPLAEHRVVPAAISLNPLNPVTELQIAPLNPSERRN